MFFGLIQEVRVFDLKSMTLFIELEFSMLHCFLMLLLQLLDFLSMLRMQGFNFISDAIVSFDLEFDFVLVIFL
jgi:hypothetical protein